MAINQLNFAMPKAEPQKKEKPQLSDIEKLLQGLSVVQAGFGIATDFAKIQNHMQQSKINDQTMRLRDEQIGSAQDQRSGIVTPDKLFGKRVTPAQGPEVGAVGLRTPSGDLQFVNVEEQMTPYQQANVDIAQGKVASAEQARLAELDLKDQENLFEAKKDFRKDIEKDREVLLAADQIKSFLNQEKPISDQVLMRNLFRISGDVGAIRPQDLEQLGSSPELKERFLRFYGELSAGDVIRPEARQNIQEVADIIAEMRRKKIRTTAKGIASERAGLIRGMNQEDVLQELNAELFAPQPAQPSGVPLAQPGQDRIQPTFQALPSITPDAQASPGAAGLNNQNDFYNNYLQKLQSR